MRFKFFSSASSAAAAPLLLLLIFCLMAFTSTPGNSKRQILSDGARIGGGRDFVKTRAVDEPESSTQLDFSTGGSTEKDASGKFRLSAGAWTGRAFGELSKQYNVTLATQTSVDRLFWLFESLRTWGGPASVAVFVPGREAAVAGDFVRWGQRCHEDTFARVSFHFLYPSRRPPENGAEDSPTDPECLLAGNPKEWLGKSITKHVGSRFPRWRVSYPYPQSHMRNLARRGIRTDFVLVLDVDVIPSPGLDKQLNAFYQSPKESLESSAVVRRACPRFPSRCALVVPVYEVTIDGGGSNNSNSSGSINSSFSSMMPKSKIELMRLVGSGKARPFHKMSFWPAQKATNYKVYEGLSDEPASGLLRPSHAVERDFAFYYEPFYAAATKGNPDYDERFLGYGFTRSTQVWEMRASGWRFLVVSPAFAVHFGFEDGKGRPRWRVNQNRSNAKRWAEFMKEVEKKYKN